MPLDEILIGQMNVLFHLGQQLNYDNLDLVLQSDSFSEMFVFF